MMMARHKHKAKPDKGFFVIKEMGKLFALTVEEHEGLLPEDDEDCVRELKEFGASEKHQCQADISLAMGHGRVHAVEIMERDVDQPVDEVGHGTEGTPPGEDGQEEIPECQGSLEVEGLARCHHFLPPEDEDHVADDRHYWHPPVLSFHGLPVSYTAIFGLCRVRERGGKMERRGYSGKGHNGKAKPSRPC